MNKKIWFSLGLSASMLLASGTALALSAAPGGDSGSGVITTPDGQQLFYSETGSAGKMMVAGGPGNVMFYKHMGAGALGTWMCVMFIITVALVWAVLLLLIAVLWHHLKDHKNHP